MISRHHRSLLALSLLALLSTLAGGCSSDATQNADGAPAADTRVTTDGAPSGDGAPAADVGAPAPDGAGGQLSLSNLTLFVNLGDSIAAGAGAPKGQGYAPLLHKNDDGTFADFAGKDLSTRWPGVKLADHAVGGAVSADLPGQLSKVPANPSGETLVIVSIGGNDLQANLTALFNPDATLKVAETVKTNFKVVLDHFADKSKYPGKVVIAWFTVYDPSDGEGSIPNDKQVTGSCIALKLLGNKAMSENLVRYNQEISKVARAEQRLHMIGVHHEFLGHGFHHDDTKATNYDASDPSLWFAPDCIHPNPRGHHELRRTIWRSLGGS